MQQPRDRLPHRHLELRRAAVEDREVDPQSQPRQVDRLELHRQQRVVTVVDLIGGELPVVVNRDAGLANQAQVAVDRPATDAQTPSELGGIEARLPLQATNQSQSPAMSVDRLRRVVDRVHESPLAVLDTPWFEPRTIRLHITARVPRPSENLTPSGPGRPYCDAKA